jgi:hypothetical protein
MNVLHSKLFNIDYTAKIVEQRRIYHALPTGAREGRGNGFFMDPCPLPKTCWGRLLHAGIQERRFPTPFI